MRRILPAIVLLIIGCVLGCSSESATSTFGLKARAYKVVGTISDQDLDAIEAQIAQFDAGPIFKVTVEKPFLRPSRLKVSCRMSDVGPSGSCSGSIYEMRKNNPGEWERPRFSGMWAMICCGPEDMFGTPPADA